MSFNAFETVEKNEIPRATPADAAKGVFKIREAAARRVKEFRKENEEAQRLENLRIMNLRLQKFFDLVARVTGLGSEYVMKIPIEVGDSNKLTMTIDGLVFEMVDLDKDFLTLSLNGGSDVTSVRDILDVGLFLERMEKEGKLKK